MALQALSALHRIALVSRYCNDFIIKINKFFEAQGIKFDAVYHHRHIPNYTDYSQIYDDFSIAKGDISSKVIIVGPFSISREDFQANQSLLSNIINRSAICSRASFNTYRFYQKCIPI
jgi:hypothetical protein